MLERGSANLRILVRRACVTIVARRQGEAGPMALARAESSHGNEVAE